jgi:hypothetical protein
MTSRTIDASRYPTTLLARVAAGWQRIADDEREGVVRAARLAAELAVLGAPPSLLSLAARVIQDEVRHVDVCARVLEGLGPVSARPQRPLELAVGLPSPAGGEGRVARTLVAHLALRKPVHATALSAARALVREPLLAWAYTELLSEEARHATFGAKAAAWVVRHWTPQQRQALWSQCLAASENGGAPLGRDPEAEDLGLLPAPTESSLPRWILPHLEPLGMGGTPANDRPLVQ